MKRKKKKEIAKEFGVEFINKDLSKCIEIKRDRNGNPVNHRIKKETKALKELKENTKSWDIVTSTPSHFPLMLLGLELGKDIFVEKPPTQKISEIEYIIKRFPDAKIGVDYIEMAHPVVRAIKDRMVKEGFLPVYFWNHRSKDLRGNKRGLGGEGSRVVLEDLVHDLSEIDFFLRFVEKKSLNDVFRSIENAYILKWNELEDKKFQYSTDVRAKFSLNFKDGRQAHIEGGFADPEIRQFYIYAKEGEKSEILFYGNTLTREKISPVAAMISGSVNIRKFEEEVKTFRSQMTKFNSRH